MSKSYFKTSILRNHAYRVLHSRFPLFGFVLKPVWSMHLLFIMIMADSCQKSFFKRSISRNHAYRVLHSRFPPFGFVLKPVGLEKPILEEFSMFSKQNDQFRETMPDQLCIVDFPPSGLY